jgi:hypothetical protein
MITLRFLSSKHTNASCVGNRVAQAELGAMIDSVLKKYVFIPVNCFSFWYISYK